MYVSHGGLLSSESFECLSSLYVIGDACNVLSNLFGTFVLSFF